MVSVAVARTVAPTGGEALGRERVHWYSTSAEPQGAASPSLVGPTAEARARRMRILVSCILALLVPHIFCWTS